MKCELENLDVHYEIHGEGIPFLKIHILISSPNQ